MTQEQLITLEDWAKARYGDKMPTIGTLRRWARDGQIVPQPRRHGRLYFMERNAMLRRNESGKPNPLTPLVRSILVERNRFLQLSKINRCPAWADRRAIRVVYEMCARVSTCLGITFNVDHIVPLRGRTVSGLHVEYNLRVIPMAINYRKGNRW